MVDTIPDDELNKIYGRKQTKMVSDNDKRDQKSIIEWLTRGKPEKVSSRTKKLAEALAEPDQLKKDIEETKTEKQLEPIRDKIDQIKISNQTKEVRGLFDDKKFDLRQERLLKEGKATTFFRNQIKKAETQEQINDILSEAKDVLGEEKNLQSLREGAESRLGELR